MPSKTENKLKCHYEGCGLPRFGKGMITGKDCCSGHYQRERREKRLLEGGVHTPGEVADKLLGEVRHYGAGSNQVSTKVTNKTLGYLQGMAVRKYDGEIPKALREIICLYIEGNPEEFEEVAAVDERPGNEGTLDHDEDQHRSQVA